MASAAVSGAVSDMECAVCHEFLTDPKLLPCAHLLCCNCLVTWMSTQPEAQCPLCRRTIVDPEERASQTLEHIAASFPTDYSMAALVDAEKLLAKQHVCQVCVDTAASSMCLDCGDMLCSCCAVVHGKLSATSHHTTEALISLTAERLAATSARRRGTCSVHTNRPSELYCRAHETPVCLLCASFEHSTCQVFIQDVKKRIGEADTLLSKLAATLSAGEAKLEQAMSQMDRHLKDTQMNAQAMLAEIEAACSCLEKAVKACQQRLTQLVVDAHSEVERAVNDGKVLLLQRHGNLTSHKHVMQRARNTTPSDDIGDMATAMESRVNDLDLSTAFPSKVQAISSFTLTIDPTLLSRLEQELSTLGEVQTTPTTLPAPVSEEVRNCMQNMYTA